MSKTCAPRALVFTDVTECDAGPPDTDLVRKGQGWEMESQFGLQASQTGSPRRSERHRRWKSRRGSVWEDMRGWGDMALMSWHSMPEGALPNRNENGRLCDTKSHLWTYLF